MMVGGEEYKDEEDEAGKNTGYAQDRSGNRFLISNKVEDPPKDTVTVGFEIENMGSISFVDNGEIEYAMRITKSKIYDLATKLGIKNFGNLAGKDWDEKDRETAFAYCVDKNNNKIFGLYLDTPPELELNTEGKFTKNVRHKKEDFNIIYPYEVKSISPSGLFSLSEVDSKLQDIYQIIDTLNSVLPLNQKGSVLTAHKSEWRFEDFYSKYKAAPKNTEKVRKVRKVRKNELKNFKTDINYGVPIELVNTEQVIKKYRDFTANAEDNVSNNISLGKQYNQHLRDNFPIKTPLEFLFSANGTHNIQDLEQASKDIIPPTGVSSWDAWQRIAHLKYIQQVVKDEEIYKEISDKISANIEYYEERIAKYECNANDKVNVFSTVHHSAVMPDGRVIFEKRAGYLGKNGITELGHEISGAKVMDKNSSIKQYYEDVIKKQYCQLQIARIEVEQIQKSNQLAQPRGSTQQRKKKIIKRSDINTEKQTVQCRVINFDFGSGGSDGQPSKTNRRDRTLNKRKNNPPQCNKNLYRVSDVSAQGNPQHRTDSCKNRTQFQNLGHDTKYGLAVQGKLNDQREKGIPRRNISFARGEGIKKGSKGHVRGL